MNAAQSCHHDLHIAFGHELQQNELGHECSLNILGLDLAHIHWCDLVDYILRNWKLVL